MPAKSVKAAKPVKAPKPRLEQVSEAKMTGSQRALRDSIMSGPRQLTELRGPFAVWLHAPEIGELAQKLGAFCRLQTRVPPRLSEFAILVTASLWQAQYEWFAHAPIAERAGVKPDVIAALRAGRAPKRLPKDERAVYDFVQELYRTNRVSDRTYKRLHALFGDAGMVEFVGILGYYVLVAMSLNVFRMPLPPDEPLPFRE
jgi:4-carboxymuconolactone decarboxylase